MTQANMALVSVGTALTPREYEVAQLVAHGLTNREIAEELVISAKTAKNHVQRVLDKLGVSSRAKIIAHADRLGLVTRQAPEGGPSRCRAALCQVYPTTNSGRMSCGGASQRGRALT